MISFIATLKGQRTDSDGEGIVTFTVPLSDIDAVLHLAKLTQQALKITVELL